VAGRVLRVVAVGSGVALGLTIWALSLNPLSAVGRPQVEAMGMLLALGVMSARAVPGVQWAGALSGVVAAAAAWVAANAVNWVAHRLWQQLFGAPVPAPPGRVLFYSVVAVVGWAVTAVLLRVGDGPLPGPAPGSLRRAAVRAVPVGAATGLGSALFSLAWLVVGQLAGGSDRFAHAVFVSSMRTILVSLVVWVLVVVATTRLAGLRARDIVFLIGAGLIFFPLYSVPSVLIAGYRPSDSLMVTGAIALAAGLTAGIWATRSPSPDWLEEPVALMG
jgi:hypothetical protein